MRNLLVHREALLSLERPVAGEVSHLFSDAVKGALVMCTKDGIVAEIPLAEGRAAAWDANYEEGGIQPDTSWFHCSFAVDTGSILCINHNGKMVSIRNSSDSSSAYGDCIEVEGFVDCGIAAAQWSPDQSTLVLVTRNDSVIVMTSELEIVQEVPVAPMLQLSPCAVSWSGDGEYCAVYSVDVSDGIPRIRIYNKVFELHSEGRGVMEGPASSVRDLCGVVAFAPNASLVAGVQKKPTGKFQVVFFERNGLRHGEFDIRLDHIVCEAAPLISWLPVSLFWDLSSSMIVLGFKSDKPVSCNSCIQIYYRENYHWYLKQQWVGQDLSCHGFDSEQIGRLYFSEIHVDDICSQISVLRIVDLAWDTASSATSDCTVAVADGVELLLTPLGKAVVPPPMCLYRTPPLIATPRHVSFWTREKGWKTSIESTEASLFPNSWGVTCLCDLNQLYIFFGDSGGTQRALSPHEVTGVVDLKPLLRDAGVFGGSCRQALVLGEEVGRIVHVVLLVTPLRKISVANGPFASFSENHVEDTSEDVLIYMDTIITDAAPPVSVYIGKTVISSCTITSLDPWGAAGRSSKGWASTDAGGLAVAIGMYRTDASFAVLKLATPFRSGNQASEPIENTISAMDVDANTHCIPELCHKIIVISPHDTEQPSAADESQYRTVVIGLSVRNHLYCGEILIATGVSSISVNCILGCLMYVTVGTRPTLNFIDTSVLHLVDPMQSIDDLVLSWSNSDPRPVERGSRIVASVPGAARVVLQMPRGNLETCEPRHLALKKAKLMILTDEFFECLVFLRRQRIDLNLMYDFNPEKFLLNTPVLVSKCLKSNPDLLSLLISSWETGDVTQTKYRTDLFGPLAVRRVDAASQPNKVNTVCAALRNSIAYYMFQLSADSSSHTDNSKLINPILCTYARQQPPKLAEALRLIQAEAMGVLGAVLEESKAVTAPDGESSDLLSRAIQRIVFQRFGSSPPTLGQAKAQALIKYLSFLVNKEDLFNAALAECDFSMARAIAKQCQMDPKIYLPLLENFEAIGNSWTATANSDHMQRANCLCQMKFRVFEHLKDFNSALNWGIATISTARSVDGPGDSDLYQDVLDIIEGHELQLPAIRWIRKILTNGGSSTDWSNVTIMSVADIPPPSMGSVGANELKRLLSDALVSSGSRSMALGSYKEAVAAFMTAEPPNFLEAIQAAKALKDWKLTLALASRFVNSKHYCEELHSSSTPRELAALIVDDFQAGLEQGMSESDDYFSFFSSSIDFSPLMKNADPSHATVSIQESSAAVAATEMDRSLEVAMMCIEYLDCDVERAVDLLVAARKWMQSAQIALKYNRQDLVEKVGEVVRQAALEALASLDRRGKRHKFLTDSLRTCWADVDNRLKLVAESDPQLASLIEREKRPYHSNLSYSDGAVQAETRSVIHGGPIDSDLRSEYSRATNMSNASGTSMRSGVSTVSVLSNLSRFSTTGSTVSDTSTFSVRGLEHSLLSRGTVSDYGEGKSSKSQEKQRKRNERHMKGNKGGTHGGADIHNLKGEIAWVTELCQYCDMSLVANAIADIRDTLVLLGDAIAGDVVLAIRVQNETTKYTSQIVSDPPPPAPLYPVEWLRRKNMEYIRCFQEWPVQSPDTVQTWGMVLNKTMPDLLWWKIAANSIVYWHGLKNDILD